MATVRCCPSCHRVWNEANEFCPADGTGLVSFEEGADPLVGLELDGRYRLKSLIGVGGMGFVYLADQLGLGRQVAIKMLFAERTRDPQSLRRFRREALALAGIDHPGVVRVLEYGDGEGKTPYIVMELLQGQPLDEVIAVYGKLPPKHAVHVCAQLADALGSTHEEGVIHRDLKPANIQLDVKGHDLSVRILDFGLALLADQGDETGTGGGRLTRHGVIFGTPEYMSPEQINGEDAGAGSDLYSLGILLFELLTGNPPFIGPTSTAVLGMQIADEPPALKVPGLEASYERELADLVAELLAKDPDARPLDADSVSARLRAIERQLPDPGPPTDLVSAASRASNPDDATLEIDAPVPGGRGVRGITSERLWRGLTRHRDADRELESALSAHGRQRRVRVMLGGLIGGVCILAAIPIVYSYLASMEDSGGETDDRGDGSARVGRLPPLTKVKLGESPIRLASNDAIEEMPGGGQQQSYEEARHQLERALSERGLRPRDLRAHREAREMWEAQEDAARSGDWSKASAGLTDLRQLADRVSSRELATARLRRLSQRPGPEPTEVQQAALSALRRTVPPVGASPQAVRRFMERLDELDQTGGS